MTRVRAMTALANDYLTERRQLGFDLSIQGSQIKTFARFVDESGHTGPLTIHVVLGWVKGRAKNATPFSWARRLETGTWASAFRRNPCGYTASDFWGLSDHYGLVCTAGGAD